MKPDWKYAPEWANWLAQNGDGVWGWYEREPQWIGEDQTWIASDDCIFYHAGYSDPDSWGLETLEQRP